MHLFFSTKRLSPEQQQVVQAGLTAGLTGRQVRVYANPALSIAQMEELRLAFLDGLPIKEVKSMADPSVSAEDMRRMRNIYVLSAEIQSDMKQLHADIQANRTNHFNGSPLRHSQP